MESLRSTKRSMRQKQFNGDIVAALSMVSFAKSTFHGRRGRDCLPVRDDRRFHAEFPKHALGLRAFYDIIYQAPP